MPDITFNFTAEDVVKTGRTTDANIEAIKELLEDTPHIPKLPAEQIVIFLLACNNDIEATKICIVAYFRLKADSPELYANRDLDSDDLVFASKVSNIAIMPLRTKDNNTVCVANLKDYSYYNFHFDFSAKLLYMFLDLVLYENPPSGLIIVINIKGVGLMHITRLKPAILKKFFQFLQEALPTQLRQIHVLESSYVFDKILMFLKPFMSKELYAMILTHPPSVNMDEFFEKHVTADCMPCDFGGNLPKLEQLSEQTRQSARKLNHFFRAGEEQIKVYKQNKSSGGYF